MNDKSPEELARINIDAMLKRAGWDVVSRDEFSPRLNACALKEGLLEGNQEADYLLIAGGKVIGVLEAKRQENCLGDKVAAQAQNYAKSVPACYQIWQNPLPFVFLSNGETLLFADTRKDEPIYEELKAMRTPKELVKLAGIRAPFAALPALPSVGANGLRCCQYDAISRLEESFKNGKTKALITLATGAGKTFTACTIVYRLLTFTPVRRVLFLVDRNNLGKQAEDEFHSYKLTQTKDNFGDIYTVARLKNIDEAKGANVVISTIQRLFAVLTGQEISAISEDEEDFQNEIFNENSDDVVSWDGDVLLPSDFFDLIIVDECHRSIYGKWQKVLKYFNAARIIGLTATPTPETEAFFDKNRVATYSFEDSVRDGVNVPPVVYRIKTKVSEEGGAIEEGELVDKTSKFTGETATLPNSQTEVYEPSALGRAVLNKVQIKTVVKAYKDVIYTALYPEREPNWAYIPKTLFFAKTDIHADEIVKQIAEVFKFEFQGGKLPQNFVQKITHKAGDSNALIRSFRNDKDFRIAVTVTLVATGTDVKPLECVVFMRDVESSVLYTQMKGRGCRSINFDKLREITPNARGKDKFYIIDAVGVTEHDHSLPQISLSSDGAPTPPPNFERLLELLSLGNLSDDYLILLSNRLSRCHNCGDKDELFKFESAFGEKLERFIDKINVALPTLPPYFDINEPNYERKELVSPLVSNIKARAKILEIHAGYHKSVEGDDTLIYVGFGQEEAKTHIEEFERYLDEHKDQIEALRIIYNSEDVVITNAMLSDLQSKLLAVDRSFTPQTLWYSYAVANAPVEPLDQKNQNQLDALTNLIALARFAFGKISRLVSPLRGFNSLFNLYINQEQRPDFTTDQKALLFKIAEYIAQNGYVSKRDIAETLSPSYVIELNQIFGKDAVNSELEKLAKFILKAS